MKPMKFLTLLFVFVSLPLFASNDNYCDTNSHVVKSLEAITGKSCDNILWADVRNIQKLRIDMEGDSLTFRDFSKIGLYLSDLEVVNLGNKDVYGVFDGICVRTETCRLALSFMGQSVVFTHERDAIVDYPRARFFAALSSNLTDLELDNVQFELVNKYEDALESRLLDLKKLTRLKVSRSNLRWINSNAFDDLENIRELVLTDNKIEVCVLQIMGDLPQLEILDISGNPWSNNTRTTVFNSAAKVVTVRACNMGEKFKSKEFVESLKPKDKVKVELCM